MGRVRKITADEILDAAERVVMRLGAAGLSIDAVAQEANVSKSTIVYDHKSKSALLLALIRRWLTRETERQNSSIAEAEDTPHPELFGRIKVAERAVDDAERAAALAISSSLSEHETLQNCLRKWIAVDLDIMADGPRPQAALMAYLALTGFYNTKLSGLHRWSDEEQAEILDNIRAIYTSFSMPARCCPDKD